MAEVLLIGWFFGRRSIETIAPKAVSGSISAEVVAAGAIEVPPDTIYVPAPHRSAAKASETHAGGVSVVPGVVPIDGIETAPARDSSLLAAAVDWNTVRTYSGVLFDDKKAGILTYSFPVQFNRAGQIEYQFQPAPIAKPRLRIRPTIGGEYYLNGQWAVGAGVQYGQVGINLRALRREKSFSGEKFTFGVGAQFIF